MSFVFNSITVALHAWLETGLEITEQIPGNSAGFQRVKEMPFEYTLQE